MSRDTKPTRLKVKNWETFQHYKDRNPHWIKLYLSTLTDYKFCKLPDNTKAHLVLLWLFAAKSNGYIPIDAEWLRSQISADSAINLTLLVQTGWLIPVDDDDNVVIASNLVQNIESCASLDKRREEESTESEIHSLLPSCDTTAPEKGMPFVTRHGVYHLTPDLYARYLRTYPDLDIDAELSKAQAWLETVSPSRRKTAKGMPHFLTRWLNRASGRDSAPAHPAPSGGGMTLAQVMATMITDFPAEDETPDFLPGGEA